MRMKIGICDEDMTLRTLVRDELPKVLGIVKLVSHLLGEYQYSSKHEKSVLRNLGSILAWHEQPSASSEVLMVYAPSCRHLHGFITSLYQGKWDHVFVEMGEEGQQKKRSGSSYAEHGKFHLVEDIDTTFRREKLQMESAVKYAAGILPPSQLALTDSGEAGGPDAACSQGVASWRSVVQASDAEMEDDGDDEKNKDYWK